MCRLEEAEGECAECRGVLGEVTSSREELRRELERIRGECTGLQAQLAEEKVGHQLAYMYIALGLSDCTEFERENLLHY